MTYVVVVGAGVRVPPGLQEPGEVGDKGFVQGVPRDLEARLKVCTVTAVVVSFMIWYLVLGRYILTFLS